MKNIKAFYIVFVLLLFSFLIYFRPDLGNLRNKAQKRITQAVNGESESISASLKKQIYAPPPLKSDASSEIGTLTKSGTVQETNRQREKNNLPKLRENEKLEEAAMAKAEDVLEKQYFNHISPTGSGPADLAENAGYEYIVIGENLALGGFENDVALVEAWMNSPGHRENILNSGFREIGVAVLRGEYEGKIAWVAVQEFGTAASYCPQIDMNLRKTIDAKQKKISDLKKEIDEQKKNIDSLREGDKDVNKNAVGAYNDLVSQFNGLAEETKSAVKKLNSQIEAYNSCLKEYSGA